MNTFIPNIDFDTAVQFLAHAAMGRSKDVATRETPTLNLPHTTPTQRPTETPTPWSIDFNTAKEFLRHAAMGRSKDVATRETPTLNLPHATPTQRPTETPTLCADLDINIVYKMLLVFSRVRVTINGIPHTLKSYTSKFDDRIHNLKHPKTLTDQTPNDPAYALTKGSLILLEIADMLPLFKMYPMNHTAGNLLRFGMTFDAGRPEQQISMPTTALGNLITSGCVEGHFLMGDSDNAKWHTLRSVADVFDAVRSLKPKQAEDPDLLAALNQLTEDTKVNVQILFPNIIQSSQVSLPATITTIQPTNSFAMRVVWDKSNQTSNDVQLNMLNMKINTNGNQASIFHTVYMMASDDTVDALLAKINETRSPNRRLALKDLLFMSNTPSACTSKSTPRATITFTTQPTGTRLDAVHYIKAGSGAECITCIRVRS